MKHVKNKQTIKTFAKIQQRTNKHNAFNNSNTQKHTNMQKQQQEHNNNKKQTAQPSKNNNIFVRPLTLLRKLCQERQQQHQQQQSQQQQQPQTQKQITHAQTDKTEISAKQQQTHQT